MFTCHDQWHKGGKQWWIGAFPDRQTTSERFLKYYWIPFLEFVALLYIIKEAVRFISLKWDFNLSNVMRNKENCGVNRTF